MIFFLFDFSKWIINPKISNLYVSIRHSPRKKNNVFSTQNDLPVQILSRQQDPPSGHSWISRLPGSKDSRESYGGKTEEDILIGKMVGKNPWILGRYRPLNNQPHNIPSVVGIYWVYPLLKGFLVVKQLGYHPKGTAISPMINLSCWYWIHGDTADGRNTAPGEVGSLSHYSIYTILCLYILGGAGFLPATELLIDDWLITK